jgi:hypothetical protein
MLEEYENKRRRQVTRMKSVTDYVMGILFLCLGLYFLLYRQFGINIFRTEPTAIDYVIGVLFVGYGGWRIYRGYKKNYFR